MGRAKGIIVKPISASGANRIIKRLHYSGKVVQNSQVHLGVFLDGDCGGALQFGPSLDKRKLIGLVAGTLWNEFIELNRLALADWLPRNSESRALGYAMRWLRKTYPWLKWVVSFADATQCGDGTIYRASGFLLTLVRRNKDMMKLADGRVRHTMSQKTGKGRLSLYARTQGASRAEGKPLFGFQLRYIYFLDPSARDRLAVPIIPFAEIQARGAGMYRGKRRAGSETSDTPADQAGEGGAAPTPALSSLEAGVS